MEGKLGWGAGEAATNWIPGLKIRGESLNRGVVREGVLGGSISRHIHQSRWDKHDLMLQLLAFTVASPTRRKKLPFCFHVNSAHHIQAWICFPSTSETSTLDLNATFFYRNTTVLHYSALIPHEWRLLSSSKSLPAASNILIAVPSWK